MTEDTPRPKRRPWKRFVVAVGISVLVLVVLCWKTGTKLSALGDKIKSVDYAWLAATFLVSAAVHILMGAHKWYLILRAMGCDTTFGESLFVRMGSDPVRIVLPFKTGELSNIAYYWRRGKLTFAQSASWILFDKALNTGGTFFWLAIGLVVYALWRGTDGVLTRALTHQQHLALLAGIVIAGVGVALSLAVMASAGARRLLRRVAARIHPKLGRIGEQLLTTFETIPPRRKAWLLAYGALFQLRPLLVCGLLMRAYQRDFNHLPGAVEMLVWGSIVVACSNVPYVQWGTGARELALMVLFGGYLAAPTDASTLLAIGIWMAIAIHIVPALFGLPVLGSFLGSLETGHVPSAVEDQPEEGAK